MAYEMLQTVIGTAVIDHEFRTALMNGSRRRVVEGLHLSDEETDAVMSIRAGTLEQFAAQLDRWIMEKQHQIEPPTLDLPPPPQTRRKTSRVDEKSVRIKTRTKLDTLVIQHSS